jgi:putative transposase
LYDAWTQHRRSYGARRLTAEIHDRGRTWNRKRVARLMSVAGIEDVHRRRHGKKRTRLTTSSIAPDLVKRRGRRCSGPLNGPRTAEWGAARLGTVWVR